MVEGIKYKISNVQLHDQFLVFNCCIHIVCTSIYMYVYMYTCQAHVVHCVPFVHV